MAIASVSDLKKFGIAVGSEDKKLLERLWRGRVSVVLPCNSKKFEYLHLGKKSLAFRIPKKPSLVGLLKKTGPLITTSANLKGSKPVKTVTEARAMLGDKIGFYVSEGELAGKASWVVGIKGGKIDVLRRGGGKLPK